MRSNRLRLLLVALALARAAGAETLERIVAVVDERPIFLSDLRAVMSMDALAPRDALERVVDEMLLLREAEHLPQPAPGPLTGTATPSRNAAAEDRAVRRRAAIRRYVAFRFRPQVRIEDEEMRKAYAEEWGARADAPAFETIAGDLRERLVTAHVDDLVAAWVRDLRSAARIRYNPLD